MNTQLALKFCNILKEVREQFSFLFRRGFRIVSAIFLDEQNEHLQVILLSHNCIINMRCDGNQMELGLSTSDLYDTVGFFDIRQLINLPDDKKQAHAVHSFERTVQLMEHHMDEILLRLTQLENCKAASENGQLLQGNCPFFISPATLFAHFAVNHVAVI